MTDSVSEKLSSKYRYLKHACELGLVTPQTLLISGNGDEEAIQDFVKTTGAKRFIVRSMNACEDGSEHSYAGHFWSSEAIATDEISNTIFIANENNQQALETLNLEATPQLMLQEFIEHSLGGVLFAPWSFFSDYYYVEYSTKSVQEVVAGNSTPAVLSKDTKHTPLLLHDDLAFLNEKLAAVVNTLKSDFTFLIDCEWAYSKEKDAVVVLQVRPQTHLVGAIQSVTPEVASELSVTSNWKFGTLSESLGNLSPLSFSLLEKLYEDSLSTFQSIGYKAQKVDFLLRLPDGTVLVDPAREKAFYQPTLMGGFWKSFRASKWQNKANGFLQSLSGQNNYPSQPFSYPILLELFQFWMVANILSNGEGRKKLSITHGYELSWNQNLIVPSFGSQSEPQKEWKALNTILRDVFFYELNKLKLELKEQKQSVFCHWQEYLNKDFSKAEQRQHHDAPYAIYDFSNVNEDSDQQSSAQSIGAKKVSTGTLFIIENPARFHQTIPAGSIVLAPYFDNRWVHNIQHLKGIITHKGSQLSHSAIVAREYGVPFCVVGEEQVKELKQGDEFTLDGIQLRIL